jgi:hypothetical protein
MTSNVTSLDMDIIQHTLEVEMEEGNAQQRT